MAKLQSGNSGGRIEPVIGANGAADDEAVRIYAPATPRRGSKWPAAIAVILLLAAIAGGLYWYVEQIHAPPVPTAVAPPAIAPARTEPAIRHPIEAAAMPAPLPPLARSDVEVLDALAALVGPDPAGRFLVLPGIIRRVVVAVDNLPRERLAQRLSPVKPVPGPFVVSGGAGKPAIAAGNYARYAPYVRALETVDTAMLVATYVRFYPLFQEAYRELGYPKGYFNDRLVETLDLMIATPEPAGTIALVQEKVMYEFADPKLEALPLGQKFLLRMGPENARRVKAKLGEIRAQVAGRK
jgi:hypothetical protein